MPAISITLLACLMPIVFTHPQELSERTKNWLYSGLSLAFHVPPLIALYTGNGPFILIFIIGNETVAVLLSFNGYYYNT
ncbi:MAG: hypothetical protein O2951_17960 [Bacteroidetes bacterium]|nr:hypothetical protein [Bacteroidota bacterium]